MTRQLFTLILLADLLLPYTHANASFLALDWKSAGDNLVTLDTNTGLEWLDVTESANNSYNYINTQFGIGGDFEGFRYATTNEVKAFIIEFGWPAFGGGFSSAAYEPLSTAQSFVGVTDDLGFMRITSGATGDLSYGVRDGLGLYVSPQYESALILLGGGWEDSVAYPEVGSWLVRVHVPEPGSCALMLAGLLGWMALRRNRPEASAWSAPMRQPPWLQS